MNKSDKRLILVVEDEEILARALEEKLIAEGFEVSRAVDGGKGLKVAMEKHPDLILLDLLMPRMDGVTMLRLLRKDPWGANAVVIILTNVGKTPKGIGEIKNSAGNTYEYLVKTNISLSEVIEKIKQKLDLIK